MRTFKAATWNMGGGERPGPADDEAKDVLNKIHRAGVDLVFGQEVQDIHDRRHMRALGFRVVFVRPESLVAWDPASWVLISWKDVTLNPNNPYFRKGKDVPIYVHMAEVILSDLEGRTVRVGSYHTPAAVQQPDAPERRLDALKESMEILGSRARGSHTHAVLYGGDDNVDEALGHGPWGFMRMRTTGLRLVRAPSNTLGRRKVDDFRSRNLKVIGKGQVIQGPTHHNAFIQKFGWR